MSILEISELILNGFEKLVIKPGEKTSKYDACKGCDELLLAWDEVKIYMEESNISNIWELDKKQIREFRAHNIHPAFIFQLLADELHNAGINDKAYFEKRIEFCTDFMKYISDDQLTKENTRRAIADSYFMLGNETECDRLYSGWLEADPKWGAGYIGWANNYEYDFNGRKNIEKAARILEKALGIDDIRDREELIGDALSFYEENGKKDKVDELSRELSKMQTESPKYARDHAQLSAQSIKIGRNDPCPCGSGKKYKKCCGA